jgi:sec-independent protein translocase protein TatA
MRLLAFLEGPDLVIVLIIVLLIFGGSQLPKLARSLGRAQKEFQDGIREGAAASTPATPSALSATSGPSGPSATAEPSDKVVLSQAELDAMLRAREDEVRKRLTDGSGT